MKNNILKITLSLALVAILGASCKKETAAPSESAQLSLNGAQATIPVNGTEAGSFTNSAAVPSAAGWGTISYNLTENLIDSDDPEALFSQNFNGNISPATGFFLSYTDLPSVANVADVTLANVSTGLTAATTLGNNTATVVGWYNYNTTTRTIAPVTSRYIVITNASTVAAATKVLVVQLDSIVGTGTGPYNTAVAFHTKRLK